MRAAGFFALFLVRKERKFPPENTGRPAGSFPAEFQAKFGQVNESVSGASGVSGGRRIQGRRADFPVRSNV
jgi:hypothetical protein